MPTKMPPFSSVLKSRDVEDPVNVWVHRPLAYAFSWLVFPTPITPNQITFLAILCGLASGYFFLTGQMIPAGILLWTSAILDGADGIVARAKNMSSDFGRAIDGASDGIVAFATVVPAFIHIWETYQNPIHLVVMPFAIIGALLHMQIYDFYKETYLRMTRLDRGGEGDDLAKIRAKLPEAREKGLIPYLATRFALIGYLENQERILRLTNPKARREGIDVKRSEESAAIFRKLNYGPMQVWTLISLAPHSYLMAICAMADRLDIYLWIRLVLMNVLLVVAVVWQKRATEETEREFLRIGALDPVQLEAARAAQATGA